MKTQFHFVLFGLLSVSACAVPDAEALREDGAALDSCDGHVCTEADFGYAFERAASELEREGVRVDSGIWRDPERYQRLFEGMESAARGDAAGPSLGQARAPLLSELQRFSDPGVAYCGPGYAQNSSALDLTRSSGTGITYPGKCLNRACYQHDRCYSTIDQLGEACLWSTQTDICDEKFFAAGEACDAADQCDFRCQIVRAMATGLQIKKVASETFSACPSCEPKTCAEIGGECGSIEDGCGGVLRCGSCDAGDRCDEEALVCVAGTPPRPANSPLRGLPTPSSAPGSSDQCCEVSAVFDQCGPLGLPGHLVDCGAWTGAPPPGCKSFPPSGGTQFCCDAPASRRCG